MPSAKIPPMEDLGYTYDDVEKAVPSKPEDKKVHYPSVRIENVPNLEDAKVGDMVEVRFLARVQGIDSHDYGEKSNAKIHYDLELQKGCGVIVESKKGKSEATEDDTTAMKKSKGNSDYMSKLTASED